MGRLKARQPHTFPRVYSERKSSLTTGELETILRTADELSGWPGKCAAFCIHMFAWTGVRKNELCTAHREDLNVDTWTFKVRHPKGEGTYGRQRIVPIPDRLKPAVIRYLKVRDEMLARKGVMDVVPLVPSIRNPEHSITRGAIDKWVWDVSERSGVQFNPHALRRTYGQILIDNGVSVETVSVMLGHSFTTNHREALLPKDGRLCQARGRSGYGESSGQSRQIELRDKAPWLRLGCYHR